MFLHVHVYGAYITWPKQFSPSLVPVVVGSIVVVGALPRRALFASMCDLNSRTDELELGHIATETTKNICWAQGEGTVDHSTVTRGFKKFRLGCKNFDDQGKSGWPKSIDSEAVLKSGQWRSERIRRAWHHIVHCCSSHFHDLSKRIQSCQIVQKILQEFYQP